MADIEGNPVPKGRRKDRSGSESLNGAGSTGGSGGTTGGGGGGLRSKSVHTSFGDVSLNTFLKREYIKWYIILVVILILVILMTGESAAGSVSLCPLSAFLEGAGLGSVGRRWSLRFLLFDDERIRLN